MGNKKMIGSDYHEEGHSEDWLVSYADMMTLMFGFFVILYTFSQIDQKQLSDFGEEIAKTFGKKDGQKKVVVQSDAITDTRKERALQTLIAIMNLGDDVDTGVVRIESIAADVSARKALEKAAKDQLSKTGGALGEIDTKERVIRLAIPGSLLFESGSDMLRPEAERKIAELAKDVTVIQDLATIEVVGHTDGQLPGKGAKFSTNHELSTARAAAVGRLMLQTGVDARLVRVVGAGSTSPLFPEKDAKGHLIQTNMEKNRRVEIVIRKRETEAP